MFSNRVGVQRRVKEASPLALYTHCSSHIKHCRCLLNSRYKNYFSIIHQRGKDFLKLFCKHYAVKVKKVKIKTCWIEQHMCYETFYDLYYFVCCCCEAIVKPDVYVGNDFDADWDWDANAKVKAQGLLHTLKSGHHIISFLFLKSVELIKPPAIKLQKIKT